jgi:mono/diheme cytochrome c family protein
VSSKLAIIFGILASSLAWGADAPAPAPAPAKKVSYVHDIKPIFDASCAKCHLNGNHKGGLRLDSRNLILKGGESGPAAVPHDPENSPIIDLLTVDDPDSRMPKKAAPLAAEKIALIRTWIDQGLPWDGPTTKTAFYTAPLAPRRPNIPEIAHLPNPIDRILFSPSPGTPGEGKAAASGDRAGEGLLSRAIDDRTFARRVYLDTIGLLPPPSDLDSFLSDPSPDKREKLIDKLLADNHRYAENWLSFWNDALRNDYEGPGYIDGGRKHITPWLYDALEKNKPYDQFVRELIAPTPASEGFVNGIIWRGAVSASQIRELQAAQNISQVFLGINMKCASCHDSFISEWKLTDAYGLAGVFADKPLEMFRCEKSLGQVAPVKFLFSELGSIDAAAPRARRMEQLAVLLTKKEDGRFARTIVNRLWGKLMGHAIIEPTDEMDRPPFIADLLDWLASDLVDHHYDLNHTLKQIMTSRAYQLPAGGMRENEENFTFRGPVVRRMTAEQFCDAVSTITGIWQKQPASKALQASAFQLPAHWIWSIPDANKSAPVETIYLRKTINLPAVPDEAMATIVCDNGFELFVNGKFAAKGDDFNKAVVVDLKPHLVAGANTFAVIAQNFSPELVKPARKKGRAAVARTTVPTTLSNTPNPAGFFFHGTAAIAPHVGAGLKPAPTEINSDSTWKWSDTEPEGWERPGFDDSSWKPAADLGPSRTAPWTLAATLMNLKQPFTLRYQPLRAVWVKNDALMTALGRPNRERVVTNRYSPATMLQALELTNGRTLSNLLQQGAAGWAGQPNATADDLIDRIYQRALNRHPMDKELSIAREMLGSPIRKEGIADLLWSLAMLPEFQLIY